MSGLGSALKDIWRLTKPYFTAHEKREVTIFGWRFSAPERWVALSLLVVIIAINLAQVAISVQLSFFNRDWFNAIEQKDAATFWTLLITVWAFWVAVLVASNMVEYVLTSALKIRWRSFATEHMMGRWLSNQAFYRMQLAGNGTDNPDQRLQEDIGRFTSLSLSLSIGLLNQVSRLVSFSVILWSISSNFTLPGTSVQVPGLLFWAALIYAGLGTVATHFIGRRLIRLNFEQERYEADFRFSLARLREYAEPVALLGGQSAERASLMTRFGRVIRNFYSIVSVQKYLTGFIQVYGSTSSVIPYIIAAPFYFIGSVSLGVMTQTADAFGRVEGALAFFIDAYTQLAEYGAVINRLTGFEKAIAPVPPETGDAVFRFLQASDQTLRLEDVALHLPDGRAIAHVPALAFAPKVDTFITGPSGSGKSTLFRAIAGIWPFGSGTIVRPSQLMLLPQRPYVPIGSLKAAVCYPSLPSQYSSEEVAAALRLAKLEDWADSLHEERNWAQTLSLGEQQRLAIARALLARPDWLLLDEATSALDEPTEKAIYAMLGETLSDATLVSIGHRSTLLAFHERQIALERGEQGRFVMVDKENAVAAE